MGLVRCSGLRIIILGIILTIATILSYHLSASDTVKMESRSDSNPILGLEVTLGQTSISPLTITTSVTNKNTHPVTVLQYSSPLDPLALKLGLLYLTPEDASEPLDLPRIQMRRIWPPGSDSLICLEPGASRSAEIVLGEHIVSQLGKKASAVLKGRWDMVWGKAKDGIKDEALEQFNASPEVFAGDFVSNSLEITAN